MDTSQNRPIEVVGSFLRAAADARTSRRVTEARQEKDARADEIIASFPSLDDRADDWPERLVAAAAAAAAAAARQTIPPAAEVDPRRRHPLRERLDCQKVDIVACIDVISAIGPVVHAMVEDADGDPTARLYCSDGARRIVFIIDIVFEKKSHADRARLGAHMGPLVFLGTRRLLALDNYLCTPHAEWKIGGGWESRMCTATAPARLLTDLVRDGSAVDWPPFASARYAQLVALPDALVRRGWNIVPDDSSDAGVYGRWTWSGDSRAAELCDMSLTVTRPGVPRLWVVWSSGRITVTNQKYPRGSRAAASLPAFFDPPTADTVAPDDSTCDVERDVNDWRTVTDGSETSILLNRERAWMTDRGYISRSVVVAQAKGFYGDDRPPLILGRMGDTADQMASRVESYADYVGGAYGPVDPVTGAHLNGRWCRQRMVDEALATDSEYGHQYREGPIDPAGPVVTNWHFDCRLNKAFEPIRSVNLYDLPEITAYAHLVGESVGSASAHFCVIIQRHHRGAEPPKPPKAGSPRAVLIEGLKAVAIHAIEGTKTDSVHPLVARNARSLCLSCQTDLVLYQDCFFGEDVDLVRAHAWIVAHTKAAIRLFEDVAATFAVAPVSPP